MSWDFFSTETRTARKPYRCEEAGCAIKPGDRYSYNAGKVEGDMTTYRLCLECDLIATEAFHAFYGDGEGWPLGELRDALRDGHGIEDAAAWAIAHRAERLASKAAGEARERQRLVHLAVSVEIADERRRQVEVEGFGPERDDGYREGELARAASAYALWACSDALHAAGLGIRRDSAAPARWPFPASWWKPQDRRRDLVRAAALIVAEIERLDRAQLQPKGD